jgi:hypothetical protein
MRDLKDNPEPGLYPVAQSTPAREWGRVRVGDKVRLEVLGTSPSESLVVRITEILDNGENFRGPVVNESGCYNRDELITFPMKKIFGIIR